MPVSSIPPWEDLLRLLPEIVLAVGGTLAMVLEPLLKPERKRRLGWLALAVLLVALWATAVAHLFAGPAFRAMIVVDGFATFFRALVIVVGALTVLCSLQYLERERRKPWVHPEKI